MANRYWKIGGSSGYCGTGWEDKIDLCKYFGLTEEEVEGLSNESVQEELAEDAWRIVTENCDGWAEPIEE